MVINKLLNEVSIQKIWKKFTQHEEEFADKQIQINKINTDLGGLRFGYDSEGYPGVIIKGENGADTVLPFPNDYRINGYKESLVDSLSNTGLGLTYESTWDEIFNGLNQIFPTTFNVLAALGVSSISKTGTNSTWVSNEFMITTFNKLTITRSWSRGTGNTWYSEWSGNNPVPSCVLVTEQGNINLLSGHTGSGSTTINISGYTGNAYLAITTGTGKITGTASDGNKTTWGVSSSVSISKLILTV